MGLSFRKKDQDQSADTPPEPGHADRPVSGLTNAAANEGIRHGNPEDDDKATQNPPCFRFLGQVMNRLSNLGTKKGTDHDVHKGYSDGGGHERELRRGASGNDVGDMTQQLRGGQHGRPEYDDDFARESRSWGGRNHGPDGSDWDGDPYPGGRYHGRQSGTLVRDNVVVGDPSGVVFGQGNRAGRRLGGRVTGNVVIR